MTLTSVQKSAESSRAAIATAERDADEAQAAKEAAVAEYTRLHRRLEKLRRITESDGGAELIQEQLRWYKSRVKCNVVQMSHGVLQKLPLLAKNSRPTARDSNPNRVPRSAAGAKTGDFRRLGAILHQSGVKIASHEVVLRGTIIARTCTCTRQRSGAEQVWPYVLAPGCGSALAGPQSQVPVVRDAIR